MNAPILSERAVDESYDPYCQSRNFVYDGQTIDSLWALRALLKLISYGMPSDPLKDWDVPASELLGVFDELARLERERKGRVEIGYR